MRAKRYFKSMRFSLTRGFFRASLVAAGLLQCAHLAWAQAAAANAPAMAASADQVVVSGPAGQVTRAEFEQMARQIVPAQGEDTFWAVRTQVERFARNMYVQRALAVQAQQAGIALPSKLDSAPKPVRDLELTQLFMQQQVDALLADTSKLDAQARSIYRANPSQFQLPEQVRVRHILLTVADDGADSDQVKAEAKKLREQLVQGADFATLARQHSKDKANAERGGDLGLFARGRMVPAFEDAAFALNKPGELSAPVKTDFGWHLIELLERQPARQRSVDEVLPELRAKVRQQAEARERNLLWSKYEVQAELAGPAIEAMRLDRLRELKRQAEAEKPATSTQPEATTKAPSAS
jgi:peptidyl-prolyl cis-trans isomerase C